MSTRPAPAKRRTRKRANMEGTGDMPEAWANANLVLLLRDMLLNERDGKLHLLPGLLPSWVPEGKSLVLVNAPVTTGGRVSLRVDHPAARLWRITIDPHGTSRDFVLHFPVDSRTVSSIRVDGHSTSIAPAVPFTSSKPTSIEVETR